MPWGLPRRGSTPQKKDSAAVWESVLIDGVIDNIKDRQQGNSLE